MLPTPEIKVSDSPSTLEIKLKSIVVNLDKQTGKLSFADNTGKIFLSEKTGTRKLTPDSVHGRTLFCSGTESLSRQPMNIFSVGQFQDGHYNLRDISRRLTQVNSQIAIPFIYSSKGYGLLWHQYGLTDFNPADNFITLEKQEQPATGNNQMAEVTTTSGTQQVSAKPVALYVENLMYLKMGNIPCFSIWVIWATVILWLLTG